MTARLTYGLKQMEEESKKKSGLRNSINPAIVSTVLSTLLYFAIPDLGLKVYLAAWFGTFFVWWVWITVMSLY